MFKSSLLLTSRSSYNPTTAAVMARRGALDSIVEAQYRNLALATKIIAAKRRSENIPHVLAIDTKESITGRRDD